MQSKVQASSQVELFFESLLYTNSLWNVVIYSARCDDFQLAMRSLPGTRILMRCFCQRKVEKEEKYTPVTTMVTTSLTVTEWVYSFLCLFFTIKVNFLVVGKNQAQTNSYNCTQNQRVV